MYLFSEMLLFTKIAYIYVAYDSGGQAWCFPLQVHTWQLKAVLPGNPVKNKVPQPRYLLVFVLLLFLSPSPFPLKADQPIHLGCKQWLNSHAPPWCREGIWQGAV